MTTQEIVQKLLKLCDVLRDDGWMAFQTETFALEYRLAVDEIFLEPCIKEVPVGRTKFCPANNPQSPSSLRINKKTGERTHETCLWKYCRKAH